MIGDYVMSKKTMGDYMRMMNGAEKEQEKKDVDSGFSESNCDCSEEDECECNSVNEGSITVYGVDPMFQESVTFLKYTKDMLEKLKEILSGDMNKYIETDEHYTVNDYLILGVTLEQGVIVVLKCNNEFDEEKNLHIEVSTEGVSFKGEV
jgi:hypothetical protein